MSYGHLEELAETPLVLSLVDEVLTGGLTDWSG